MVGPAHPESGARSPAVDPGAVCAIVVAAGRGRRMGRERNKLLCPLGSSVVLAHTLRAVARPKHLRRLVLVTRDEERDEIAAIAREAVPHEIEVRFASGGETRSDSVRSGVRALADPVEIVLIHDGARPFLAERLLASSIAAARAHGAAVPVVALADTLKQVEGDRVVATPDRALFVCAQTPQAFRVQVLREALAAPPGSSPPTDDAAMVEAVGRPVRTIPGDPWNLKITRPDDFALAELLVPAFREREGRAREAAH